MLGKETRCSLSVPPPPPARAFPRLCSWTCQPTPLPSQAQSYPMPEPAGRVSKTKRPVQVLPCHLGYLCCLCDSINNPGSRSRLHSSGKRRRVRAVPAWLLSSTQPTTLLPSQTGVLVTPLSSALTSPPFLDRTVPGSLLAVPDRPLHCLPVLLW